MNASDMSTKRRQIITIETIKRTVVQRVKRVAGNPAAGNPVHQPEILDERPSCENYQIEKTLQIASEKEIWTER
jgi:hypothetical protein